MSIGKSSAVKRPRKAAERGGGRNVKTTGFSLRPETIDRLKAALANSSVSTSAFVDAALVRALDKIEREGINPDRYTLIDDSEDRKKLVGEA